eukprot:m.283778 g.283778  ORF g.283778 m.283778 type:complete len:348 (+) comp27009_c1_seq2:1651-2694(+)
MLHTEWPRGGTAAAYAEKVAHSTPGVAPVYALPCSYVLVTDGECVGHGRLTECFEGSGGSAVAATYIIIAPSQRGTGLGSVLMRLLEVEATSLGYHYVYLWTHTAVGFYRRLGYMMCEKVSLHRACLQALDREQVDGLERMLSLRLGRGPPAVKQPNPESAADEVGAGTTGNAEFSEHAAAEDDVWLKKRLVESVGSAVFPLEEMLPQMENAAAAHTGQPPNVTAGKASGWEYSLLQVPWQRQIGPRADSQLSGWSTISLNSRPHLRTSRRARCHPSSKRRSSEDSRPMARSLWSPISRRSRRRSAGFGATSGGRVQRPPPTSWVSLALAVASSSRTTRTPAHGCRH